MDEIIKYMESCKFVGNDELVFLIKKYGRDGVISALLKIVSNVCCSKDNDFYNVQIKLWERYGYCFSVFHIYPFYDEILNKYKISTRNQSDLIYNSLDDEVRNGFHLLSREYINIMDNDCHVDFLSILNSVSSGGKKTIMGMFDGYYLKNPPKSKYDKEIYEYIKENNDFGNECDRVDFDDYGMINQVLMYLDYMDAKQTLVNRNLGLIGYVVDNFNDNNYYDDYFQEGYFGLLKSCDRFDVRYGYKFSTYAPRWIYQVVCRYCITRTKMIRVGIKKSHFLNKLEQIIDEYKLLNGGKNPSLSEISEKCGLSEDNVYNLLILYYQLWCDSLQREVYVDESRVVVSLGDTLESKDSYFEDDIVMKCLFEEFFNVISDILSEK